MAKKPHKSRGPHKEDIKAAIRKLYGSVDELSRQSGVHKSILRAALIRPYPKAEAIIAKALNSTAPELWPERYTEEELANHRNWRRLVNVPALNLTQEAAVMPSIVKHFLT